MQKQILPLKNFNKVLTVPSDKSISHRGLLFGALAKGESVIYNPLFSEDIFSTADCLKKMGADLNFEKDKITVQGIENFKSADIFAGNSGTTMRLLCGILSAQNGKKYTLSGDESLSKRPMRRVCEPLKAMGAEIESRNGCAPLTINGKNLSTIEYRMPVDSAQVKSAILLAGLYANGVTKVIENVKSRDHSEIMLKIMGANIKTCDTSVSIQSGSLKNINFYVPGDISSAAFPLVLAAAKTGSYVKIKKVGINPTRTGILEILQKAGAKINLTNISNDGEKTADIEIEGTDKLKAFTITKEIVPSLVDEIPVLTVLACFCEGKTAISGAQELKVKESNRIELMVKALKSMGADIEETADGMIISGKDGLDGGTQVETRKDHRIAMSLAVAGALSKKGVIINDSECVNVSYPGFYKDLGL